MKYEKLKVVIPSRYGSSRLNGKPLIELAGRPMIEWVYRKTISALPEAEVLIATDDKKISDFLEAKGFNFVMTSRDHESGTDRIAEVATMLDWHDDNVVLNVQGDEPLLPEDLLTSFARFCCSHENLEMATVMAAVKDSNLINDPDIVKIITSRAGNAINFSRLPIPYLRDKKGSSTTDCYYRHIGLYGYSVATLKNLSTEPQCYLEKYEKLEQLRALWMGITVAVMEWGVTPPHGVDSDKDINRVSDLLVWEGLK